VGKKNKKRKKQGKGKKSPSVVVNVTTQGPSPLLTVAQLVAAQAAVGALARLGESHRPPPHSLAQVAVRHPGAAFDVARLKIREGLSELRGRYERWRLSRHIAEEQPPPYRPRLPSR
jgi:hypothetical protein